jgi:CubicO group peptidase (beta-lactamase class C family)
VCRHILADLSSSTPSAQSPGVGDARSPGEDARMELPGVAIGILDNGVITARGFAPTSRDARHPKRIFPIASISKTLPRR